MHNEIIENKKYCYSSTNIIKNNKFSGTNRLINKYVSTNKEQWAPNSIRKKSMRNESWD